MDRVGDAMSSAGTHPAANTPDSAEGVTSLRHQLRTPLNHILGYAEMLLQDWVAAGTAARKELGVICYNARHILAALNTLAPLGAGMQDARLVRLRTALAEPSAAIVRAIGNLAQEAPAEHLMDLLRINIAAGELLRFAEGRRAVQPPALPAKRGGATAEPQLTGTVLVVDDDEANRDILSRQIQRLGHKVGTAESGAQALRLLEEQDFDLVLLDVVMPGLDGMALLHTIKNDPKYRHVPVIMISALDKLDEVANCLNAGAEDYLTKPFEPVVLKARLSASLERKRLRDQEQARSRELERANEELQQFAYILSHDLQEPLRTMIIYAQLLTRRWQDRLDRDSEEFLNFIVDGARRMQNLVDDVLSFSRASRAPAECAHPVHLEQILGQVCANLAVSISESGAVVSHDPLPAVMAGSAEMIELLQNLIGNAIKYRRPNIPPVIHISSEPKDGFCVVSVADNGIGVPDDRRDYVFLPFKRLHGKEIPGTGIGLAVCRKIVEKHGGRIWVDAAEEGGAVFRFTLPAK